MFIDRRIFKNIDWMIISLTLAIIVLGLPVMYSASQGKVGSGGLFLDHLLRIGIGLLVMLTMLAVDYHFISRNAYVLYALNVLALILVDISGVIGLGARRWLAIGPVGLQPSELFKITLILTLALYFSRTRQTGEAGPRDLSVTCAILVVPLLLILKQPDLGTAGIVGFIFLAMVGIVGLTRKAKLLILEVAAATGALVFVIFRFGILRLDNFLKPYQMKRIIVLFNPELDPLGASYHINQSKIAIGSGGLFGKGFLNGTQNQLRFLPQQHTDFVFSVLAEEWGFIGVLVVLMLYMGLLFFALQVARDARDRMGSLIALGVTSMIFFHAVINIGMTIGYIPVVGLPLPLMSYGGSSFMVVMMGIGLLLNVRMRRFII